jgi:ABC-2 type transport system permease protein
MSKIKILTKNYLNVFIGSIKWRKRKGKVVAAGSFIAFAAIGIMAMMFYQAYALYKFASVEDGLMSGTSLIFMLAVLSTITRGLTPSKSTDTDLLLSMPIKKSEIVISNSISKYIFELFPGLLFFSPYVIMYFILVKFTLTSFIGSILVIFLLPLLSVGLSNILATIINLIGGRFKAANIIKIISTLLIVFVFMFLFSSSGTNNEMMSFIYPAVWMKDIIISFDISSLVYFLLLIIIPFIIGVYLFSKSFGIPKAKYVSSNKELKFKKRSVFTSLLVKEGKRYLSSPIYVINTIIGPLFIIGISVYSFFIKDMLETVPLAVLYKPYIIVAGFIFMIGMTTVSASSISMEGKNIWILKVHPISPRSIFLAKAGFNILLIAPVSLIACVILKFTMELSILRTLIIMIICVLVSIFTGLSGLLINLWFPKMEWQNDVAVVKQSVSVLLSILPAMIVPTIIFVPIILSETLIRFEVYGAIIALVYTTLNLICWKLLMTQGVKSFNNL